MSFYVFYPPWKSQVHFEFTLLYGVTHSSGILPDGCQTVRRPYWEVPLLPSFSLLNSQVHLGLSPVALLANFPQCLSLCATLCQSTSHYANKYPRRLTLQIGRFVCLAHGCGGSRPRSGGPVGLASVEGRWWMAVLEPMCRIPVVNQEVESLGPTQGFL